MAQLVQLFVNGTIVFAGMTDDVDQLLVKVDGKVFLQTSNPESSYTYCPAGRHLVPKLERSIPCGYCLQWEERNDRRKARD